MNCTIYVASFSTIPELYEKDLYPVYGQLWRKSLRQTKKDKQKYIYNMTSSEMIPQKVQNPSNNEKHNV